LTVLLAFLSTPATAASLDLLELGGAYGTPGTTDATATWWNPAGLAAGSGTRFHLEAAPVFAEVDVTRTDPGYTADVPGAFGPASADYGGNAFYSRATVVPFLGIASDLGQPGLGVGLSLAVPHGRGAGGDPGQVTRHHLVEGGNQAIYAMVSGAYEVQERFAFGVTGAFVSSSYQSNLYTETVTSLNDGLAEEFGPGVYYQDTVLEADRYATHAVSDTLRDTALTFGLGARVRATDQVTFSLAYRHGFRVENEGTGSLAFSCPSVEDTQGRAGAELNGLCNSTLTTRQSVGYDLPSRIQGSVLLEPVGTLRLELMGGYVGWSRYRDLAIGIQVDPASVPKDDAAVREATAALVSQDKLWARDSRDSFWLALDGKVKPHERVELGARLLYDRASVPTNVLSPNNYDANTVAATAVVLGHVHENLSLGFSAGQYFAQRRNVTDSAWSLAVDPAQRVEPRYQYPVMNGSFGSTITRLGIIVRGQFAHGGKPS
jgi:long-chain fatty acid transport protein